MMPKNIMLLASAAIMTGSILISQLLYFIDWVKKKGKRGRMMTYKELYDKALWDLEHDKITLGEFEKMIEPLNKEIPKESEEENADSN